MAASGLRTVNEDRELPDFQRLSRHVSAPVSILPRCWPVRATSPCRYGQRLNPSDHASEQSPCQVALRQQ